MPAPPLDSYHEVELGKIFDALLSLQNTRVQLGTFFGTANIAALSIAFQTRQAGLLFAAALLVWVFLFLDIRLRRLILSYYARGLQLRARFAPEDDDFALSVFLSATDRLRMRRIADLPDVAERMRAIHAMVMRSAGLAPFWLPWSVSALEVLLAVVLWRGAGWSLF